MLYIDRRLVHEVSSPQAFEGLRMAGRKVRSPEKTLAIVDHNIQTTDRRAGIADEESRIQIEALAKNARDFGIEFFDELDIRQGIVHIVGPDQDFPLCVATATPRRSDERALAVEQSELGPAAKQSMREELERHKKKQARFFRMMLKQLDIVPSP